VSKAIHASSSRQRDHPEPHSPPAAPDGSYVVSRSRMQVGEMRCLGVKATCLIPVEKCDRIDTGRQ